MKDSVGTSCLFPQPSSFRQLNALSLRRLPLLMSLATCLAGGTLSAQVLNQIPATFDSAQTRPLANHHPLWANSQNDQGLSSFEMSLTLVMARSPRQEAAFEQLLADQQNPASPDYHHWLSPAEIGERFGLSESDIAAVTAWIQAQGMQVNWVSPSRTFIGFGGASANVGRAFQTEVHTYKVNGANRISVSSNPMIPVPMLPVVKAIHGLYTIDEQPQHFSSAMQSDSPEMTLSSSVHFIAPADFQIIYDLPTTYSGHGKTIGIVGWSRTNFDDFTNFRQKTGNGFQNPTEVIPTAYGGVDPGPAYTVPPSGNVSLGAQMEATLDVTRAGSIAQNANLLLVVTTPSNGGIGADAQYLVQTTPVPAQVMSISFGACESAAGPSGVAFWDTLFQQAAAEGISVFVSSGDSGASGCDAAFSAPPASPQANSPNYICSSSYATCVGGTEFNDSANPSLYWSSSNGTNQASAQSNIPEGGWNEPLTSGASPVTQVASSGGGVSANVATPSWQTGTGVPSARAGRYTPDISFSGSCHDGYFGCFAAAGGSCVSGSNGSYQFVYSCGTSASAPSMAGVTALLDEKQAQSSGNLNPLLYRMAASVPNAFHDATPATSGVASCSINTPSMCNNSIPSPSGLSGGQAGYPLTTGYDEVTGLGSLDVQGFFNNLLGSLMTPTMSLSFQSSITTAQQLVGIVTVSGIPTITPTGTVRLTGGGYDSGSVQMYNGIATFIIAAGALSPGSDILTATYTPDSAGSAAYTSASGSTSVTVTAVGLITPAIWVGPQATSIATAQSLTVEISVNAPPNDQAPTGTVVLTSGAYTSAPAPLAGGISFITIPPQALAAGTDLLTVTYTPDTTSKTIYTGATGTASVTVTVAELVPMVGVVPSSLNITTAQSLPVMIHVGYFGGFGYQIPTGTVTLTSGGYSSAATALSGGIATIGVPAGSLSVGTHTLTASYSGDGLYAAASGSATVSVAAPPPPAFTIGGGGLTVVRGATTGNTTNVLVTPSGGFTGSVALTATITTTPAGAQNLPTLSFGTTSPVNITGANPGTATLTITTTATTAASAHPLHRGIPWYATGEAALACILLLGIPRQRRSWRVLLGSLVLFASLAGSTLACGGGGGGNSKPTPTVVPGTTPGAYFVTITGTSGTTTSTTTISVTVQ